MTDSQGAGTPAPKSDKLDKELSYIGARLREKSTYAGLTVVLAALLPLLAKYAPALAHTDPGTLVGYLSSVGIGIGGLIAIFTPENGSKAIIAALATSGALALAQPMPASAQPAVAAVHHVHRDRRHIAQAVPLPAARPDALPSASMPDAGKGITLPTLPSLQAPAKEPAASTVAQNILSTAPADIAYAIQLATAANTPQSNVRKQCYVAIQAAIPVAPSGTTMPPGPDVVTHVEQAAELADTLNPSSPVFVNCAGAAALEGQTVLNFVNTIVTGIAGISLAPKLPIPIP